MEMLLNKNVSVLRFKNYIIDNISYINNDKFEDKDGSIDLDFDFDANVAPVIMPPMNINAYLEAKKLKV